jgi:hypothetical protein
MIFQWRQCTVFSKGRVTQNNGRSSSSLKGDTKDTIARANIRYTSGIGNWDIELSLCDSRVGYIGGNRGKWGIT